MFSGIVEETAKVVKVERELDNMHFTLSCSFANELKIDQSVAHNGVCLTVVKLEEGTYTVTESVPNKYEPQRIPFYHTSFGWNSPDLICQHLCIGKQKERLPASRSGASTNTNLFYNLLF